jgi:hypothetical protein
LYVLVLWTACLPMQLNVNLNGWLWDLCEIFFSFCWPILWHWLHVISSSCSYRHVWYLGVGHISFKLFMTMHWWFIMTKPINAYTHVYLLYYKQRSHTPVYIHIFMCTSCLCFSYFKIYRVQKIDFFLEYSFSIPWTLLARAVAPPYIRPCRWTNLWVGNDTSFCVLKRKVLIFCAKRILNYLANWQEIQ